MTERVTRRRPRTRVRATGVVLVLGATTLLAACTGADDGPTAEPSPAAEAVPAAEAARQEVLAAVQGVFGPDGWTQDDDAPSATEQPDGRCVVFLPDARTSRDGTTSYDQLEDVPAAIAPVLAEHGFGEPSDVVHPEHGGSAYVEAEDPAGWSVTVTTDGDLVRLDVSGPVELDPCDEAGLPALG